MTDEMASVEKLEHVARPHEVLYHYHLPSVNPGTVTEIRYLDVPVDAPPSQRYQWFLNETPLTFQRRFGATRYFVEGVVVDTETVTVSFILI